MHGYGGYRWEVMTSNGSESLNNGFKYSSRLPVPAIVEETFLACLKWFVERREASTELLNVGKQWSHSGEFVNKSMEQCWTCPCDFIWCWRWIIWGECWEWNESLSTKETMWFIVEETQGVFTTHSVVRLRKAKPYWCALCSCPCCL